ncbi:MAG: NHLP family bacteriocin export ABC transporter peptidase/permease/ATPase subunit [Pseudomonadota bacterium]
MIRWLATLSGRHKRHGAVFARTPTVIQMEAVECGAAALAIVLGYFGKFVPLEDMRAACGVSRDGSKASNVMAAAKRYGLNGKAYRRDTQATLDGPFPSIVFWNYNHFLVAEGCRGDQIFLNDPALGRRTVTRDEFDISYSGIVLTFETAAEFEPSGTPPKVFARLIRQALAFKWTLGLVLFVGALLAIPTFVVPGLTAVFVNNVLIRGLDGWLEVLILLMIGAIAIQFCLGWIKESGLLRLETQMALRRSADFVWTVLRLPASFFAMRYLGDIASRITSVERVAHLVTSEFGGAAINVFTALVIYLLMTILDPVLAAISFAGAAVNVVMLRMLRRARLDTSIRLQTDMGKLFATSVVGLRSIESLKASGTEDDFFSKWSGYHARMLQSEQRLSRLNQVSAAVPPMIVLLTMAFVLAIGTVRVMDGVLTVGALLAYQILLSFVVTPVHQLVTTAERSQEVAADLARLDDVRKYRVDWRHQPIKDSKTEPERAGVGLVMDSISFGYSAFDPPLIEDLSVTVQPGAWLALVGASGSGKSTIGRLISGLFTPWGGHIRLDGRELTSLDRHRLALLLTVVDQDIALFAGILRENINLWDTTISDREILEALRDADLAGFVESLPDGLDTVLTEGGQNLSGGQRQRLEIARGLVNSPALIVLDEATSALDPPTEAAIMRALRRRGLTCIVIAHRLSTVRTCDEIIVLDQGKVVERGQHEGLVQAGGTYAALLADGGAP